MAGSIERLGKVLSVLDQQLQKLSGKVSAVDITLNRITISLDPKHLYEAVLKERQGVHTEMVRVSTELSQALGAVKDTIMHNVLPGSEDKKDD